MSGIRRVYVDNELIYLNKSKLGWGVVHPIKQDGKIVWKNLIAGGNWANLIIIAIIVALILGCVMEYSKAVEKYNECIENSIKFPDFITDLNILKENDKIKNWTLVS